MIESLLQQAKPTADQGAAVRSAGRVTFDGRHPKLLDHRDHVLARDLPAPGRKRTAIGFVQ